MCLTFMKLTLKSQKNNFSLSLKKLIVFVVDTLPWKTLEKSFNHRKIQMN